MPFSIQKLLEERWGENYELLSRYVNPQFSRVLKTIGFDKIYKRAEGAYLFDEEGNRTLDLLSGHGVFALGRNHPRIKEIIKEVLDLDLPHLVQMDASWLSGLLAEKLVSLTGGDLETVLFTNSGTEAVEGALKLARGASGRTPILYLDQAFHGLTLGSLSVNGNKEFRNGFGELLPATAVPINDLEALERELSKKIYAAFIVEPIQGKGVTLLSNEFLQGAERLCKRYGTYLIADEVQCGLGRTGRWFAYEETGIHPDLVCIAKALSGGFVPVGAILYRKEIYKKVFSSMDRCMAHGNTFGKNNLAMACGLATLQIMEEEKLLQNAERLGTLLMRQLNEIGKDYEMFKEARGRGLMIGIEFCEPKSLKLKTGWKMIHGLSKGLFGQMIVVPLMTEHHILSQVAGHNDVIKFLPPLIITEEEVKQILSAFQKVVADCHKFPGSAWETATRLARNAMKS